MPLSVVILAAGQGKRMNSDLPKVLQPLAGKPLLGHVLDAARGLEAAATCVVYGHGGEQVLAAFPRHGRAAGCCRRSSTAPGMRWRRPCRRSRTTISCWCSTATCRWCSSRRCARLVAEAGEKSIAILSVMLPDPTGYGRIVRDGAGNVVRIVEHKDANTKERAIHEVQHRPDVRAGAAACASGSRS